MADPSMGWVEGLGVAIGSAIAALLGRGALAKKRSTEGGRPDVEPLARELREHIREAKPLLSQVPLLEVRVETLERLRDKDRDEILKAIDRMEDQLGKRLDALVVRIDDAVRRGD